MHHSYKKWLVLIAAGLPSLLVCIDFTIVNIALSTIQRDLGASISQLQWIILGFGITFCTFNTTMGRFGDIIGNRLMMLIGMVGFAIVSIGAGWAQTTTELIVFRTLQGFFGASLFPNGMAIVASAFEHEEASKALGIYNSILGFGLAFGPVLGGFILSTATWHWIFFINAPVIIISVILFVLYVDKSKNTKKIPIDWLGAFILTLGLGSLVFAVNEGSQLGWTSPVILVPLITSAICFFIMYKNEQRTEAPILPLRLLANKGFFSGLLVYVTSVSFSWVIIFFGPLYLQNVVDLSVSKTGWILLIMTSMTMIMPGISGNLMHKNGVQTILTIQLIALIGSYVMQLFFSTTGPVLLIIIAFFLYGAVWGIGNGIGMPLALSKLEERENIGVVSGSAITLLNIFAVISLTIIGVVFRYIEKLSLYRGLHQENISISASQEHFLRSLLSEPEQAKNLIQHFGQAQAEKVIALFKQAFVSAYHISVLSLFIASLICIGVTFFLTSSRREAIQ